LVARVKVLERFPTREGITALQAAMGACIDLEGKVLFSLRLQSERVQIVIAVGMTCDAEPLHSGTFISREH
jgi:hypothetical protein